MVVKSDKYLLNNPVAQSDTCIIVTSYSGHLMFLKNTLRRYMQTGKYVLCSYDSHGKIDIPNDIWEIPHAWVFKHQTFGAEKRLGWLWDIIYASGIIRPFYFKYVITVNGDTIWDKPSGIHDLTHFLGYYDLASSSSDSGTIHTCNVVWDSSVFLDFVDYIVDKLNNNIPEGYSPEVLLRDFSQQESLRNKVAPIQPIYPPGHFYAGKVDHYSSYNQDSTWQRLVGYRNLGGEHKAACLEHLEPIPKEYVDMRKQFYSKHEVETLWNYYNTGDRRWLYKYWAEGEDSYWNRRYYPLEYYGDKYLSDDSKRKELGPPSERLGHFHRWKYNSYILKDEEYYSKWKEVIEGGSK